MIEVENISKRFGNFLAVNDVSFSVPSGQIVGLLGPNGAGKTTTMRMLTGFFPPDKGRVLIDGIDMAENPMEAKQQIGYMPESAPLYADMIVEDYLSYVAAIYGVEPSQKIPVLCEQCALGEVMHKNISELSRGYRQRVGLAHALMNDPKILVLDEPTSGLDPNQIEDVRTLIKKIGETRTILISTHILSEVETLCARIIIISQGKLVADSPTDQIRSKFGTNFSIFAEIRDENSKIVPFENLRETFSQISGVENLSPQKSNEGNDGILISVANNQEIRPQIFAKSQENHWVIFEISVQRNSLEDVFRSLTKGESK